MAFIGRGNVPEFNFNSDNDINNQNDYNNIDRGRIYRSGYFHVYYYIPLDNTYVLFEMIATIIIAIIAGIAFLTTYKMAIPDPIDGLKKAFVNINNTIAIILLGLIILANYISKDKNTLIKRLLIIFVMALVMLLGVGIGKLYLDNKYTRSTFEQFYIQEYGQKGKKGEDRIAFDSSGFGVKDDKTFYIDECVKSYNVFTIRTYTILSIDIILMGLIVFQIYKLNRLQKKKDKLAKDDIIVYDEEENVKF